MGLTVALGAAALAVVNTALEWAPKLDLFPWAAWASLLPFCDISVYAWVSLVGFFPGEIPTDLEVDNTAQTTRRDLGNCTL